MGEERGVKYSMVYTKGERPTTEGCVFLGFDKGIEPSSDEEDQGEPKVFIWRVEEGQGNNQATVFNGSKTPR